MRGWQREEPNAARSFREATDNIEFQSDAPVSLPPPLAPGGAPL